MKGIMSLKGHSRRVVLAMIDVLCYIIVCAAYLLVDYLFLNDAITHVGQYVINTVILLVFISAFRVLFRAYTNIWRYTNTSAYLNLIISDLVGGIVAWFIVYFTIDRDVTSAFMAITAINLIVGLSVDTDG